MSTEARVTRNLFDSSCAFAADIEGKVEQFTGVRCIRTLIPLADYNCAMVSEKAGVRPETLERIRGFFEGLRSEWKIVAPPLLETISTGYLSTYPSRGFRGSRR